MRCPLCKSPNPDGKKFCGDCGGSLQPLSSLAEPDLRARLRSIIKEELKDQKVLEVEIAESIASRAMNWAKAAAFVAGIPLALLLLVLSGFGVKKYSDFWDLINEAEVKIKPLVVDARKRADELATDTARLKKQSEEVRKQIASLQPELDAFKTARGDIQKRLAGVEGEVQGIKKKLFVGEPLTPEQFERYVGGVEFSGWLPKFAVLHNTGAPKLSDWHRVPSETRIRNLAEYYANERGWSGGPHLIIDDRMIWVFNPLTKPGIHSPSWNQDTIGITMVGDYSIEPFNEAVRDNTVKAIATLYGRLKLKADTLRFHSEDPRGVQQQCPGKNVDKADMIRRVDAVLSKRPG